LSFGAFATRSGSGPTGPRGALTPGPSPVRQSAGQGRVPAMYGRGEIAARGTLCHAHPTFSPSPRGTSGEGAGGRGARGRSAMPFAEPDTVGHPQPHAQPLPRSWGRGRPPSRGTSEKAVGGEGPRGSRSPVLHVTAAVLPLSARNERGEGRGEGRPRAQFDVRRRARHRRPRRPSSHLPIPVNNPAARAFCSPGRNSLVPRPGAGRLRHTGPADVPPIPSPP
jgi:hypothetical protein